MEILILSPFFPQPLVSGGHTRIFNLIQQLADRHTIDYFSLADKRSLFERDKLTACCRNVFTIDISAFTYKKSSWMRFPIKRTFRRIVWLLKGVPLQASGFFFPEFRNRLDMILKENNYDIVQVEFPRMALHLRNNFFKEYPASKIVIDYDISFVTQQRLTQQRSSPFVHVLRYLDYRLNKRFACKTWQQFDTLVVVSEIDRQKVKALLPHLNIEVVPNGVDTKTFIPVQKEKKRLKLVMLGGVVHTANVDAFDYLYREIYYRIKQSFSEIELFVVGEGWRQHPVTRDCDSSVSFPGFVRNITTVMNGNSILIAPIRIGGGTRLKIIEAMALGVPVVSTSTGCEGLDVVNGRELIIADTPEDFAAGVCSFCEDELLCDRVIYSARQHIVNRFDWHAISNKLDEVYKNTQKQCSLNNNFRGRNV